jgi:hypothetical protein
MALFEKTRVTAKNHNLVSIIFVKTIWTQRVYKDILDDKVNSSSGS